jgi:hypothetical protein
MNMWWFPCPVVSGANAAMFWCSIYKHSTNTHGELFHKLPDTHGQRYGLPPEIRYATPGSRFVIKRLEFDVANGWNVHGPHEWMIIGGNTGRLSIQWGTFSESVNSPYLKVIGKWKPVREAPPKPQTRIESIMMQDYWWHTNDDRWIPLHELSLAHALNIMAMLMRCASALQFRYVTSSIWYGAPDEVDAEVDREANKDPEQFVRDLPLYKAIEARAIRAPKEEPL